MKDGSTLDQLRQSLGLLQVAFDASSEAMVIVEPSGEVRWANQAAADLWGNGLAVLLIGQPLEKLLDQVTTSSGVPLAPEAPEHPLQCLKRGDGKGVFGIRDLLQQLEWRQIPQQDAGYLLLLARDLGPQERALQQQRQFVNQLAHELNTPLAILKGTCRQLAKQAGAFGVDSKKRIQQAQQEINRLVRLMRNLLVLTDLENGRRQLMLKPVEICSWLDQWCSSQDLPVGAELSIIQCSSDFRVVDFDQSALEEVLEQLLSNSLRYSESPAVISICLVAKEPNLIELHWHDQGPGIKARPHHQVFDRFVRLEEHRNPNRPDGAGLGLAICEAIMQQMQGSICLGSDCCERVGAGFVLSWPQVAVK